MAASEAPFNAPTHVVAVGASSGGVPALIALAANLPKDMSAAVVVVLHVGSQPSQLPELLQRAGPLPARHVRDGEPLRAGTLYVAPPDRHVLVDTQRLWLSRGPRENHTRPAIDPLMRSAALAWRERAVGIVLTGELDDGTAGLEAIKACGGTAIVQDPTEALSPSMPTSALRHVDVDFCVPVDRMAALLLSFVGRVPSPDPAPPPERLVKEQAIFNGDQSMENMRELGEPSQLTCPECGGTMTEMRHTRPLRYRCHTGHAYTALSLESAQADQASHALLGSLRALREREALLRRLSSVAQAMGDTVQADAGLREAERVQGQAQRLAELISEETRSA